MNNQKSVDFPFMEIVSNVDNKSEKYAIALMDEMGFSLIKKTKTPGGSELTFKGETKNYNPLMFISIIGTASDLSPQGKTYFLVDYLNGLWFEQDEHFFECYQVQSLIKNRGFTVDELISIKTKTE